MATLELEFISIILMQITNKFNLPPFVVEALTYSDYTRGDAQISVTQLIDSPRIAQLKKKFADQLESDAVDFVWSRFGTSVHSMFEESIKASGFDAITEERMFVDLDGWTLSGAVDMQEVHDDGVIVSDFKVTSVWSVIYDKTSWHDQLNTYAYLIRKSKGLNVKKLQIVALLRDWTRRKAEEDVDYPTSPIAVINIPLWSDQKQDEFIDTRMKLHKEADFDMAMDTEMRSCTSEEMWAKPTKYAVMKKNRKRAIKLHDDIDKATAMAESLGQDHFVETRVGELTRCKGDWCGVSAFCTQWQNLVWNGENQNGNRSGTSKN